MPVPQDRSPGRPQSAHPGADRASEATQKGSIGRLQAATAQIVHAPGIIPAWNSEGSSRRWSRRSTPRACGRGRVRAPAAPPARARLGRRGGRRRPPARRRRSTTTRSSRSVRARGRGGGRRRRDRGHGTNDTAHSVQLTEQATEAGVDAVLVVTPYYNKPNRRGLLAHFEAVRGATDLPVVDLQHPLALRGRHAERPARRSWREIDNVVRRQAGSLRGRRADRRHGPARRQRRHARAPCSTWAAPAGSCVASHLVGPRDAPHDRRAGAPRRRSTSRCGTSTRRCPSPINPIPIKAALNMLGHDVGGLRLPLVEASDEREPR